MTEAVITLKNEAADAPRLLIGLENVRECHGSNGVFRGSRSFGRGRRIPRLLAASGLPFEPQIN